ncbi:MAG: hypothetical protein WCJ49_07870 [Deltaproteobacteria bacterium]
MPSSTPKWIALFLTASLPLCLAQDEGFAQPDTLILKDGSTQRGVIVRNTAKDVWIQQQYGIAEFPKSEIVRILDEVDTGMEFTEATGKGDLPSWRVMVNDIRNNDAIKMLEQIPATYIDNGYLKNVPYLSFRINNYIEMNVYGDPDDPAAIEFGIYGKYRTNDKLRRTLRSFVAGFLSSRKEVAAIYRIPFSGGKETLDTFNIQITPPSAPDAYGGWWISIYNPKSIDAVRMTDQDYARITRPPDQIVDKSGRVKRGTWTEDDLTSSVRLHAAQKKTPVFLRGFFRDASGQFRLLTENNR